MYYDASHLHSLTNKIMHFPVFFGQVLLFVVSAYFPIIRKCFYTFASASVYLCVYVSICAWGL